MSNSAITWIKDRATKVADEPITVEGVVYSVERLFFAGRLPFRMISQAAKARQINTDTQVETINVNTRTNRLEYTLTTYTAI
jgi:hypothetical protein